MKAVYTIDDLRDWCEPSLRFAVLGDPVAHSASPAMHNAALALLGRPERYCRIWIRPDELAEALQLLTRANFSGVNLTVPHKTAVLPQLDEIDPLAKRLGAVNTIVFGDGKLTGYNTDGPGIVRALHEEFGVRLGRLRVLILGAGGGAGKAIASQCAIEGCPSILLVNRTLEKAEILANEIGSNSQAVPWNGDELSRTLPDIDLIINASTVGMNRADVSPLPADLLQRNQLIFDTIYVGRQTPLQMAAQQAGARSANGLSLLLHQGAISLEHWLGKPAPLEVMRRGLLDFVAQVR